MIDSSDATPFARLVRNRRMTRAFTQEAVASAIVDDIVDLARRSPAAGNTAALDFLVLEGTDQVGTYWETTLPAERRDAFPWPDLLLAPVLIVPYVRPRAYIERYGEPDKARTGLGVDIDAWSTPYWWIDGGMAAMLVLLAAEDRGLGALFFGLFDHENDVARVFGVPPDRRALGAIAIGHPAPEQRSSQSARRRRPSLGDVTHRGRWSEDRGPEG